MYSADSRSNHYVIIFILILARNSEIILFKQQNNPIAFTGEKEKMYIAPLSRVVYTNIYNTLL